MDQLAFTIDLCFDEDSQIVSAKLHPSLDGILLTNDSITEEISKHGYGDFYVLDPGVSALLEAEKELREQCQQLVQDHLNTPQESTEPAAPSESPENTEEPAPTPDEHATQEALPEGQETSPNIEEIFSTLGIELPHFDIAKRLDGTAEVTTSNYDLQAFITVNRPYGGREVSSEDIQDAIIEAAITYGVLVDAVNKASELKEEDLGKPILIAKGIKPVKGKDSTFEALVSSQITSGPKIDEKGQTNYKDINEFVLVEEGTPLMRRHAPLPGKSGTDVLGRPIPAPMGDITPFSANLEGATVASDDKDLLVASTKGHPVILVNGVSVDSALVLKNVSLATGNIDFDGSVHVKEDVADGMEIKASGEVIVNGVVGKAIIRAEGSVIIDQGLIGGTGSEAVDAGQDSIFHAQVFSKGTVKARFATFAKINADKDISINEYASHCDLWAKDKIHIGQEGGKGNLIGGNAQAFNQVAAKCLGTKGSVPTEIRIGASPDTLPKLRRIMQNLREREQKITEINESLHTLMTRAKLSGVTEQQKEVAEKLNNSVKQLLIEIDKLKKEEKFYQTLLMKSKAARVIANQRIYQNVIVHILHTSKKITEDMGSGQFKFDARQIVIER